MKKGKFILAAVLGAQLLQPVAFAGEEARGKILSFDGDTVEGVNKKPFDSLSALSEKDRKRRRLHLYRKRGGFPAETETLLDEMSLIHD